MPESSLITSDHSSVRRILITGTTGNVGNAVLQTLLNKQCLDKLGIFPDIKLELFAASRSKSQLSSRFEQATSENSVTTIHLDFQERATWSSIKGLGIHHLFLMRPPAIANVENNINPFIDFARQCGVQHIVFLSVAGAGSNRFVPHRKVEEHLQKRSDHYTNLRPGFFAQNLETAYRQDIREDHRIYVPAGTRQKVNWIDVRDIAEVAALILFDPEEHRGKSYTLAGPEPVSWSQVVRSLSESLQREIRYEAASIPGYLWHLYRRKLPWGAIRTRCFGGSNDAKTARSPWAFHPGLHQGSFQNLDE